jgi:mRNA interferase RelE/StbE
LRQARKLVFSRDARKFLASLAPKQFKQIVVKIFELTADPTPHDSESLHGIDARRIDSGEYRIIYILDVETVYLDAVGKLNDNEGKRGIEAA